MAPSLMTSLYAVSPVPVFVPVKIISDMILDHIDTLRAQHQAEEHNEDDNPLQEHNDDDNLSQEHDFNNADDESSVEESDSVETSDWDITEASNGDSEAGKSLYGDSENHEVALVSSAAIPAPVHSVIRELGMTPATYLISPKAINSSNDLPIITTAFISPRKQLSPQQITVITQHEARHKREVATQKRRKGARTLHSNALKAWTAENKAQITRNKARTQQYHADLTQWKEEEKRARQAREKLQWPKPAGIRNLLEKPITKPIKPRVDDGQDKETEGNVSSAQEDTDDQDCQSALGTYSQERQ
ncbi:hypothetical protein FISHEDRAFT_57441 [Fistulina hepatica ATCC 64428]|uniref:Uncharacterized protein n=1 Tax=Fistulina hepatica ATCC 64428 TaxID=1128425 RepID=A0A0D7AIG7_9AGAR|nr:hypothetical protein FISHEDRAFT_57441 [Fistulina hepatica ATCC 64428]